MANIRSQIKRNRQSEERRVRNKALRSELRTRMKRFRLAADSGDRDAATEHFRAAVKRLDQAASKGAVHHNYAANRKSQMARRLERL